MCEGVVCSDQAVLEVTAPECHFPATPLKIARVLPAERAQCFSTHCSQDGLQTCTAGTEHGKFFAAHSDTKNTVKVKKIPTMAKLNRRENLDIEMECNYPSWNLPRTLLLRVIWLFKDKK